ncbi:MAG: helix-turn-helix domain-containing protein [Cyclobacteriaceae bacterium]
MGTNIESLEKRLLVQIDQKLSKLIIEQKEVFNTVEATKFLGFSRKQLYKLMSKRVIPYSQPGGKLAYFKKQDLIDYMLQNRQKSKSELEYEANLYLEKEGGSRV